MEEIYISRLELQRWFLVVIKNIYLEFGIEVWLILWHHVIQISFAVMNFQDILYSQQWKLKFFVEAFTPKKQF